MDLKFLRNIVLVFLMLNTGLLTGYAQSVKFSGSIRDKNTNEPLIGASIVVKGTTQGASADINGKFNLTVDVSKPQTLITSYLGYANQEIVVNSSSKTYLNLLLAENTVTTKEVQIVTSRLSQKMQESPVTVERMGIQAIKETPAANFYDALANLKGVDMTASSLTFKIINTRGFNSTSPVRNLQLVDGMDNQAPGLNFSLGNFAGASELDVESVELVAGASTALYGPNAFNGVINLNSKDPYKYPGLNLQLKSGYHPIYDPSQTTTLPNFFDGALRYAKPFKNGFAFKVNAAYIRADDWRAFNTSASSGSLNQEGSPWGTDKVNVYGDDAYIATDRTQLGAFNEFGGFKIDGSIPDTGRILVYRTGYKESDVIGNNITTNLKTNIGLYQRIKDKGMISYIYNFGTGTTVYQAENRYRLKDVMFQQHRLTVDINRFYLKAFTTNEDAGKSFDLSFTGAKLMDATKAPLNWGRDFIDGYGIAFQDSLKYTNYYQRAAFAANYADTEAGRGNVKLQPGTPEFQRQLEKVTGQAGFLPSQGSNVGGTRFVDNSSLYHVEGGYTFNLRPIQRRMRLRSTTVDKDIMDDFNNLGKNKIVSPTNQKAIEIMEDTNYILPKDIKFGASFRMYAPRSYGTILSDTLHKKSKAEKYANQDFTTSLGDFILYQQGNKPDLNDFVPIRVYDYGTYLYTNKRYLNEKLNITGALRFDYRQNFRGDSMGNMHADAKYKPRLSPTIGGVYQLTRNDFIRLTFSSAFRYPTLQEQYLWYDVGRAILSGNTRGFNLILIDDFLAFLRRDINDSTLRARRRFINPVVPEKVKTLELGYKGILFNNVYVDASAYYSEYKDFLGFVLGVDYGATLNRAYRVYTNATSKVQSYGFSIGLNYYFEKYFALSGNYTYAQIHKNDPNDPIIPGFNTPPHKFNLGFGGRGLAKYWGFFVNYKFVDSFTYQGSPQFTGFIQSYSLLDAQITYKCVPLHSDIKFGVSNVLNNKHYEAYGGPLIGALGYLSLTLEL